MVVSWWRSLPVALLRLALAFSLLLPSRAAGQIEPGTPSQGSAIRWWHGAIVAGGISALMLLDEPVDQFLQRHRSETVNGLSRTVRHFGQPEVFGTVTLGMLAAGLVTGKDELTRAGGRLAATLALAGATSTFTKFMVGRPRPSDCSDADAFAPFSGDDALPSGHTAVAFALATTLADDIGNTWASAGLYTLATGVAWSRVNDHRHWLSDVAAGAVIGVTSAKLVNGHWRLFHLHPPRVLLGPSHAGIAWQITF